MQEGENSEVRGLTKGLWESWIQTAMSSATDAITYHNYEWADPPHQGDYLDLIVQHLRAIGARSVLDAGCGDGNFSASVAEAGFEVYGIDASEGGIAKATRLYPNIRFSRATVYEDFTQFKSSFDSIISVEVVEHLYSPDKFIQRAYAGLRPGGIIIITTPYWGYLKTVLLALTNRMDRALTALWPGGHIKHWSYRTLRTLLERNGFEYVTFYGCGRPIPYCWRGMMMIAQRPVHDQ
jgi:2-polyprenyl-6-hydroxyphenyl methylase/3-demethylubiquinone-9 3-methyltransferase